MDFQQAREEYGRLKAQLDQKQISLADFEQAVYRLVVRDQTGGEWQIGPATGRWLRFDGAAWVETSPETVGVVAVREKGRLPGWAVFSVGLTVVLLLCAAGAALALTQRGPGQETALEQTLSGSPAVLGEPAGSETPPPGSEEPARETPGNWFSLAQTQTAAVLALQTPGSARATPSSASAARSVVPNSSPAAGMTATLGVPTPAPFAAGNARDWHSVSRSVFTDDSGVADEWRYIFDIAEPSSTFTNYNGILSRHLVMAANYVDITSQDEDLIRHMTDMDIEEVFAFPPTSSAGDVELLCRYNDLNNYYALIVKRTDWRLIKKVDDVDTELAEGSTPEEFQNNGAWGRVRLRCEGEQIKAWFNREEILTKTAQDFPTGSWGVLLMRDDTAPQYELYYQKHEVWELQEDSTPGLYGAEEAGSIWIGLESGLKTVGTVNTLTLALENRGSTPVELNAGQIYLERADGRQFVVSSGAEGAMAFPYTIKPERVDVTVAFAGIAPEDIESGLALVIDLTRANLGRMRFDVPTG